MNILAFESSCDETAVAVVRDGRQLLSDAILSQADMHALYGGVEVRLRGNGIGQHPPSVLHHCHGGLVAGGFKG